MRTWQAMRDRIQRQLERQTGADLAAWNARIAQQGPADKPALRHWLDGEGVTGYPQMLLAWETFGYPDFLLASAGELIDAQYADRPALRLVFDAVLAAATALPQVEAQARKTYVSLLTPRRTFAVIQAGAKKRVDLGLRLAGTEPGGLLLSAKGVGNDAINVRIALETVDDLTDEALEWLRRAHEASTS